MAIIARQAMNPTVLEGEDPRVPIKPLHKMTVAQSEREMAAVGLVLESVDSRLPMQHMMFFRQAESR